MTIISLGLQLYIKSHTASGKAWYLRWICVPLGDLHVVFCAIEVIEKMKDGSGLDHLFEEAWNARTKCYNFRVF